MQAGNCVWPVSCTFVSKIWQSSCCDIYHIFQEQCVRKTLKTEWQSTISICTCAHCYHDRRILVFIPTYAITYNNHSSVCVPPTFMARSTLYFRLHSCYAVLRFYFYAFDLQHTWKYRYCVKKNISFYYFSYFVERSYQIGSKYLYQICWH